jgi:hypothetical protein
MRGAGERPTYSESGCGPEKPCFVAVILAGLSLLGIRGRSGVAARAAGGLCACVDAGGVRHDPACGVRRPARSRTGRNRCC